MEAEIVLLALQTYSLHLAFGRHPDCQHYPDKLTLEDCLKKAKKWGFAGVQIDPMHLDNYTQEYARNLRRIAESEGLFLELGVEGFDRNRLREKLNFAETLGGRFIRIFEIVGPRPNDPKIIQQRLDSICREVEDVIPNLGQMDIVLGWENHADYPTSEQLQVLEKINHHNFRACIDIGNSMIFFEPPLETVERLLPFAGGVHFKDYARTGTTFGFKFYGTPLGTGVIPLKEITEILKNQTKLEHVIYEQSIEPKSSDPHESVQFEEQTLLQSVDYAANELGFVIE